MLAQKVDKKKILQYSAILGVIFLIIIYLLLTNFVIKPTVDTTSQTNTTNSITNGVIKEVKELNPAIVETDKFKNLKENVLNEVKIENLKVGKPDPFSSGAVSPVSATSTP